MYETTGGAQIDCGNHDDADVNNDDTVNNSDNNPNFEGQPLLISLFRSDLHRYDRSADLDFSDHQHFPANAPLSSLILVNLQDSHGL